MQCGPIHCHKSGVIIKAHPAWYSETSGGGGVTNFWRISFAKGSVENSFWKQWVQ